MRRSKNQTIKSSQKKLQNTTINLTNYIFRVHTLIILASFFIHFVVVVYRLPIVRIRNCQNCFYVPFLKGWYKRAKKYEMRTQTFLDNAVNDLRYEIKFETCVKDKNNIFITRNFAFLSWTKIYFIVGNIFFLRFLRI